MTDWSIFSVQTENLICLTRSLIALAARPLPLHCAHMRVVVVTRAVVAHIEMDQWRWLLACTRVRH